MNTRLAQKHLLRISLILLALSGLSACSFAPSQPIVQPIVQPTAQPLSDCRKLLTDFYSSAKKASIVDAQYRNIRGYPHLATDRFLSYLQQNLSSAQQRIEWLRRSFQLSEEKRAIELGNITAEMPANVQYFAKKESKSAMDLCAQKLLENDIQNAQNKAISFTAKVPESYSTLKRTLGIYPITHWFVSLGINKLHREMKARLAQHTASAPSLKLNGPVQRLSTPLLRSMMDNSRIKSSLGIPTLTDQELTALFQHYAPSWHIEQESSADLPGAITIADDRIVIDQQSPTVYTYASYTQWRNNETLLQLNYFLWFPEKPKRGPMDIYAGFLDGLIWRVTLDNKGQPLFYDSIHSCGCYYQLFPLGAGLDSVYTTAGDEPVLSIPMRAPEENETAVIHLSAGEHFINAIEHKDVNKPDKPYTLLPYRHLRQLPTEDGRRSLFSVNGIIKGSERPERWLLWPMGISSAGAMRQWGHHAIAFIGRRHFDDPGLFLTFFTAQNMQSSDLIDITNLQDIP